MKIGILINDGNVPVWQQVVIDSILANGNHQICCVIIRKSENAPKNRKRSISELLLKFQYRLEQIVVRPKHDPFKRVKPDFKDTPLLYVAPKATTYKDYFTSDDLLQVQSYQPDLLIRFGFRILSGEILNLPSLGILSLHHGDTRSLRGSPPAFWEVFKNIPYTSVTAQILTEDLDGGNVVGRTTLRTDQYSYLRNKIKIYWAGVALLQSLLRNQKLSPFKEIDSSGFCWNVYDKPLYKNPNSRTILIALTHWAVKNLIQKFRLLFFLNQWNVYWYYQKEQQQSIPLYKFKPLPISGDRSFADPFVIEKNGVFTIFFEELIEKVGKAHISFVQIDNMGRFISKQPTCCLKEPFHISYPFIFERNGHEYLMPETASEKKLVIYEAADFPVKWRLYKVLLEDIRVYDATLIHHQGIDYVFCTLKDHEQLSSDVYMHIFYSKNILTEPLLSHPQNPISRSAYGSRAAGRIFRVGDELIRPAQITAPVYGSGIVLMRIDELSETNYSESVVRALSLNNASLVPMHTLNQEGRMWVVDQQHFTFRWK